ncbi:MAG: peptidoglycan -binding protein [Alphaproteobacteria bacterium]|nr:peptidoglycan -binding protein [Alphaproteobacteria bacterium]
MSARSLRARRAGPDIWPGFVDALANLLLVVSFVLSVFILAQFYLTQALSGRDDALRELNARAAELAELLAMEKASGEELRAEVARLSSTLQNTTKELDIKTRATADAEQTIAQLGDLVLQREGAIATAQGALNDMRGSLDVEKQVSTQAQAQVKLLNEQIAALRDQLAQIAAALDAAEARDKENQVVIADLGARLNQALAAKVEELARYRSEFFGRLREVLANTPGVRVEGDRFIFQSEVLFASGSADIGGEGQGELRKIASVLNEIAPRIPAELRWALRVDGHTDTVPIATDRFRSNWDLSSARALSVVNFLIARGVPPGHLAAAGFGQFHPLDPANTDAARGRNRRIELKLTER